MAAPRRNRFSRRSRASTSGACRRSAWFCCAGRVTGRDPGLGPLLAALAGGAGVGLAVLGPLEREAVVEDAARVQRGVGVVEHRERRDRGEVRRARLRDEQLRDAGIRDADHADLAVRDPRLRGDGLDHVVAVERLQGLEVVQRAAGAAGAAEVHADGGEAEELRDRRRRLATARVRRVVARVLDHGGVGARVDRAGQGDVDGQQGAVARLQVAVARARSAATSRTTASGTSVGLSTVTGAEACARDHDLVARAGLHVAEQHAAGGVGRLASRPWRRRRLAGWRACPSGAPVTATWFTLGCTAKVAAAPRAVVGRSRRRARGRRPPRATQHAASTSRRNTVRR